ncbi:MAG TPA: NUDIX hydrolase [Acidimicrobiales bacterium]|nr:NUDIX hydrolase [Acidimicrobiales bacterium]
MERYEPGPTGLKPDDLKPWVSLGPSILMFEHPFHLPVVSERVRLPDGREADWIRNADSREGVDLIDAVGAICVRDDGKILVSWQWNLGPQRPVAEFPGGGVDPGETYEAAICREVAEEVGLMPGQLEFLGRHLYDSRRSPWRIRWFVASRLEPRKLEGDEVQVATAWLTPHELDQAIAEGAIENQSMLAAWALYKARIP